ncbi:MAG: hypothetical protein QMC78_02815 [Methanocellales archaeon]|nr:hypothetical protein [Methanocellales archaeon]
MATIYVTIAELLHFLFILTLLAMAIDITLTYERIDFDMFRARLFLNKAILKRTWITVIFAILILMFYEFIGFYDLYTDATLSYLYEFVELLFVVYFIFMISQWRSLLKQCMKKTKGSDNKIEFTQKTSSYVHLIASAKG